MVRYWFSAKRRGWGWAPPFTWEGWLSLAVFVALIIAGAVAIIPNKGILVFVGYVVLLAACVLAICWRKGEPPRWR